VLFRVINVSVLLVLLLLLKYVQSDKNLCHVNYLQRYCIHFLILTEIVDETIALH